MHDTIWKARENFTSCHLDSISNTSALNEEHEEHVQWIMERLFKAGLFLKPDECESNNEKIIYL